MTRRTYPALVAWERELQRGERTTTTFDVLHAAACREANAKEFENIPQLHRTNMQEAARIIREAARRVKRQQS